LDLGFATTFFATYAPAPIYLAFAFA